MRSLRRAAEILPALATHAGALAVAGLVLVAAGQPIFADDTWWHLSMGAAYAAQGPWLAADPALHTAQGPPAPAAWLADLALHGIERAFGFAGLREAHALLVAAILCLAWSCLRRASDCAPFASLGTALFAAVGAYRFFQLRPELSTILATLLFYRLLFEPGQAPSARRVAASTLVLALWANLHAGFVLGLVLLAAALAGSLAALALWPERRARELSRARRLAVALALGLLATLANPAGIHPHLALLAAGRDTPSLAIVLDEWAPVRLFELPVPNVPPSLLTWAVLWALLLATPGALWWAWRRDRNRVDPVLAVLAAASLAGSLFAVRLAWLAIFPLLCLGRSLPRPGRALAWAGALASWLLVLAFLSLGDWPMISKGIHRDTYDRPYPSGKHHAHAVWFLRDVGLEGRLWNDYAEGAFLGYWLAPRLRVFVNGSLNVPAEVMEARAAVLAREGMRPGESFETLLDRHGIDVFFGSGLPVVSLPGRPSAFTTAYLEGATGWIPVFRNVDSGIYLRRGERNRANLRRVEEYYARAGVPFDAERGFDVERAVREAPGWAVEHGLVPEDLDGLERAAQARDPAQARVARERLAALFAALGLYARAEEVDRRVLRDDPTALTAARRLVWSLLRQGRLDESRVAAKSLEQIAPPEAALAAVLVAAARSAASSREAQDEAARLPVFNRQELPFVSAGLLEPDARRRRDGS